MTTVLFVCLHNAGRSQMAAALFGGFTPGEIEQLRLAAPLIERLAQLI